MIAPIIDQQTCLGFFYVDLRGHPKLKTGVLSKGKFELGDANALSVLQQAVVVRNGFSLVVKLSTGNYLSQMKEHIERPRDDRVSVSAGIQLVVLLISHRVDFLIDEDLVKVATLPTSTQISTTNPDP